MTDGRGGGPVDPAIDQLLDVLSSWRRRRVVYHLEDVDEDLASFDELVSAVRDGGPDATDDSHLAAILRHSALPRLADAGVVEYDARSGAVRYKPEAVPDDLLDVLQALDSGA